MFEGNINYDFNEAKDEALSLNDLIAKKRNFLRNNSHIFRVLL